MILPPAWAALAIDGCCPVSHGVDPWEALAMAIQHGLIAGSTGSVPRNHPDADLRIVPLGPVLYPGAGITSAFLPQRIGLMLRTARAFIDHFNNADPAFLRYVYPSNLEAEILIDFVTPFPHQFP